MECIEQTCPKHGHLKTRGAIQEGVVASVKARKTAIMTVQRYRKVQKYERLEKRRSRIAVHVPSCMVVKVGDRIRAGECRKISKTKSFVLIEVQGKKGKESEA